MTTSPAFLSIVLPPGTASLVPDLETALLDTIALAVVEALPEEQLSAFEDVLAKGDEKMIAAFIEANVPDAREVLYPIVTDMADQVAALM